MCHYLKVVKDIVNIALTQIDVSAEKISFNDCLPTLQNASIRWLWKAFKMLNKEIVQKVSSYIKHEDGNKTRME
jgi:hypothetical protein